MSSNSGNILLTGYPGFLGNSIYSEISKRYTIYTLGLQELDDDKHVSCDLSAEIPKLPSDVVFDLVVHAAGKVHVIPGNAEEANQFFQVNAEGTKNLVASLEQLQTTPSCIIFISSVAVYGLEAGKNIDESQPLNAQTPYGSSKLAAEEILQEWTTNKKTRLVILRLPLIVGKNPPGNLGRMIGAIKKGRFFNIGKGSARRSMVLARDIASFIPTLAEHNGIYHLTDGCHPSYAELTSVICNKYGKTLSAKLAVPYFIGFLTAKMGDCIQNLTGKRAPFNSLVLNKLTSDLTFSDEKARKELGWSPESVLEKLPSIIN